MRDYVFATPDLARDLILKAEELGFTELVLLAEPKNASLLYKLFEEAPYKGKIKVILGVIAQNKAQIPKKLIFEVVAMLGTSEKTLFEGLTHVLDVEFDKEKDYVHQRKSGINHVLLAEYKKKNISLIFGFSSLQDAPSARQAQVLGRVMQNVQLCTKQKVLYEISSLAKKPEQMRHAKDVASLARTLNIVS